MRSLRNRPLGAVQVRSGTKSSLIGASLTAACFATYAQAQTAGDDPIVLPPVDVETTEAPAATPAPKRKPTTRRAAATPRQPSICTPDLAGTPVCAEQEAAEAAAQAEAEARALADARARAGSSPFADPDAPFKADTLGNSRLQGEVKDMARSVTAITREVLDTTGTTSVRELARTTPGISLGFGEGGNSFGDNIYIRGFKANNDIYVDGIRDPGVSVHETFNTEQVEVIKGPSGTVGGRGTTGGALDIVTKKPQDVTFKKFSVTASDASTTRGTFDVNYATNERLQFRVNGMLQDGEVAGRDHVKDDREGLAFAARYKATERLTLEFDASYTKIEQTPDWGVASLGDDGGPVTEYGIDRSTFYGIPGRDFQDVTQHTGSLRAIWEFDNGVRLTNTLRGTRSINDYVLTAPSSLIDNNSNNPADWQVGLSYKSRYQKTNVLTDVLEVSGEAELGSTRHHFVFGSSFSQEDVDTLGYDNLESEDYLPPPGARGCVVDAINPNPIAEGCWNGQIPQRTDSPTKTRVKSYSIYALDTVEFSDMFALNGGVRIDYYDITRSGIDRNDDPYSLSRDDLMWNWNLGATLKPVENLTLYAAAATSTNPMGQEIAAGGGFYGGLDTGGENLSPEQNTSFEIGAKYEVMNNLLLTAALFQTTKDNAREDIGPRGSTVTQDTLKYRIQGIELGVAGKVSDRIGLFGGATFMHSEILDSDDSNAVGEPIANIAHEQFNLLATYDINKDLWVGARANYVGKRDLGSTAPNGNTLPSQWTFDLMGEYAFAENASVQVNVNNLTDEIVYDAGYRSGTPFTYVAPGREISVSLNMKF